MGGQKRCISVDASCRLMKLADLVAATCLEAEKSGLGAVITMLNFRFASSEVFPPDEACPGGHWAKMVAGRMAVLRREQAQARRAQADPDSDVDNAYSDVDNAFQPWHSFRTSGEEPQAQLCAACRLICPDLDSEEAESNGDIESQAEAADAELDAAAANTELRRPISISSDNDTGTDSVMAASTDVPAETHDDADDDSLPPYEAPDWISSFAQLSLLFNSSRDAHLQWLHPSVRERYDSEHRLNDSGHDLLNACHLQS